MAWNWIGDKALFLSVTLHCTLLLYANWAMLSGWLQMSWCQIGARPSATTMLTLLWLYYYVNHIVWHYYVAAIKLTKFKRDQEVGNPLVPLLLMGTLSHSGNALWRQSSLLHIQYILRIMHSVSLLCFVVVLGCCVLLWLDSEPFNPYPSGLLHWHWGNLPQCQWSKPEVFR